MLWACRSGLVQRFDRRGGGVSVPAVHSDWSILPKLFLGFVHLSDEIDEAFPCFWHPLLGPVSELELADGSGLAILGIRK